MRRLSPALWQCKIHCLRPALLGSGRSAGGIHRILPARWAPRVGTGIGTGDGAGVDQAVGRAVGVAPVVVCMASECGGRQRCTSPDQSVSPTCWGGQCPPPSSSTLMHQVLMSRDRWRRKCIGSIAYSATKSTRALLSLALSRTRERRSGMSG